MADFDKGSDFYDRLENKYMLIYSRGGKIERSANKNIGDIINKDLTTSFGKTYEEMIKNIDRIYSGEKEKT